MVSIEFTSKKNFKLVANVRPIMIQIARLMKMSVQRNFQVGGRPVRWQPLKGGAETPLMTSGRLYRGIKSKIENGVPTVWIDKRIPYAEIHQYGGVTNPGIRKGVGRMRRFFWFMWFTTKNEMWKWMAITKRGALQVYIPPRPYMMFQAQDILDYREMIRDHILRVKYNVTEEEIK